MGPEDSKQPVQTGWRRNVEKGAASVGDGEGKAHHRRQGSESMSPSTLPPPDAVASLELWISQGQTASGAETVVLSSSQQDQLVGRCQDFPFSAPEQAPFPTSPASMVLNQTC